MSEQVWQRAADHVGAPVADAFVILDLEAGVYYWMNGSASVAWDLLAEPTTERRMVESLVGKYKVTSTDCAAAVRRLLDDFVDKKLVRTVA